MKATVQRVTLAEALRHAGSALGRSTHEITSAVRIYDNGDRLSVAGTDLNTLAEQFLPAVRIDGEADLVVPHRPLAAFVGSTSAEAVTIEADDTTAVFRCGRARFATPVVANARWPRWEQVEGTSVDFTDPQRLGDVLYATDDSLTAPITRAAWFSNGTVATSDDRRMAAREGMPSLTALVPAAPLVAAVRQGEAFTLTVGRRAYAITSGAKLWQGRLIEGTVPDWRSRVRSSSSFELIVEREALVRSLRTLEAVAGDRSVILEPVPDTSQELTLLRRGINGEVVTDVIGCSCDFASPIRLSASYLVDLLDHVHDDKVRFEIDGPMRPVIVRSDDAVHVLMPMKIDLAFAGSEQERTSHA